MPKYVHTDVMTEGLDIVVSDADRLVLISNYTFGDSYSVVDSRVVAESAMTPSDIVETAYGTNEISLVVAAKSVTASGSTTGTPNLHVALLDSTGSRVLVVADETSDQPITSGNPVNFPEWEIRARQPA